MFTSSWWRFWVDLLFYSLSVSVLLHFYNSSLYSFKTRNKVIMTWSLMQPFLFLFQVLLKLCKLERKVGFDLIYSCCHLWKPNCAGTSPAPCLLLHTSGHRQQQQPRTGAQKEKSSVVGFESGFCFLYLKAYFRISITTLASTRCVNWVPKELNSEILDESMFLLFWLLYKDSILSET